MCCSPSCTSCPVVVSRVSPRLTVLVRVTTPVVFLSTLSVFLYVCWCIVGVAASDKPRMFMLRVVSGCFCYAPHDTDSASLSGSRPSSKTAKQTTSSVASVVKSPTFDTGIVQCTTTRLMPYVRRLLTFFATGRLTPHVRSQVT